MRHTLTILVLQMMFSASTPAVADTIDSVLRPRTDLARMLLAQGAMNSPTLNALIARLEQSDLIVYIDVDAFRVGHLQGALTLMGHSGGRRYVRISLDAHNDRRSLLAWLGHELQHAVELADHPEITSNDLLAAYYGNHAMIGAADRYESTAAIAMRIRIAKELSVRH